CLSDWSSDVCSSDLVEKFLRDRERTGAVQPALEIPSARLEIREIESAKRLVRENIDPDDLEIFAWKIRQRREPAHERRGGGNSRSEERRVGRGGRGM